MHAHVRSRNVLQHKWCWYWWEQTQYVHTFVQTHVRMCIYIYTHISQLMYEHVRRWKTPYFQHTPWQVDAHASVLLLGGANSLVNLAVFPHGLACFLPPNPGAMVSKPSSCWGVSRVTSWLWYCCFNSGQWHKVPLVNSSLIPMVLTLLTMIIYKSTKKNEVEIILPGIAILTVAFCQDHESLETKAFPASWADPESEFWGHLVGGDGRKRSWAKKCWWQKLTALLIISCECRFIWEPSKRSEKNKIWRFLSDDPVHSKHLPAFLLTMPGRGQSCLSTFRNWRKEFLRNWEMFTYYHVNMYHTYFREREREKKKICI